MFFYTLEHAWRGTLNRKFTFITTNAMASSMSELSSAKDLLQGQRLWQKYHQWLGGESRCLLPSSLWVSQHFICIGNYLWGQTETDQFHWLYLRSDRKEQSPLSLSLSSPLFHLFSAVSPLFFTRGIAVANTWHLVSFQPVLSPVTRICLHFSLLAVMWWKDTLLVLLC